MRDRRAARRGGRAGTVLTGTIAFALGARAAQRPTVSAVERRSFDLLNGIPHSIYPPVWAVMQSGSLAGVFAGGAAAALADRRLATRILVGGSATWGLAKGVKHFVRRGRPEAVFGACRTLGRPQRGLGYPSGHAAVAAAMATMAMQVLPRRWLVPVWSVAALTGASRIYVGAHLPLDVVGGIGLGCATGALTDLLASRR